MQKSILIIFFVCACAAASPIVTEDKAERRLLSYITDLDDDRLNLDDEAEQTFIQFDETNNSELQDTNAAMIEVLKRFLDAVLLKADFSEQSLGSLFKALAGLAPPLFGEYAGVVKMLLSPSVARAAASILKSLK